MNAPADTAITNTTTPRLVATVDTPAGEAVAPVADRDMVETWPHLVFIELLALLLVSTGLWAVSMGVRAPLEEIADPAYTPQIAKAPWYFVGLQELLVYFDPWIAGVVLPGVIILGLVAIPYIDRDKHHVGVYSARRRPFAYGVFTFGLVLWFGLIAIGALLRGPHWAWYWPWEPWHTTKPSAASAVSLPLWAGLLLTVAYGGLGTLLLARWRPGLRKHLGGVRHAVLVTLLLGMLAVVVKMALRLLCNVHYVVETPWFSI